MKVKVDENVCIGCGACAGICPDVFEVDDTAKVIAENVPEELEEDVKDAIEGCPVMAISEVTDEEE